MSTREAPLKSGSLITAQQATEQGRTVYAVPGPIDKPTSAGCNRLIQQGAKLVMDGGDVLDDLITRSGLIPGTVNVTLMRLEMKRLIRALPGRRYVRLV